MSPLVREYPFCGVCYHEYCSFYKERQPMMFGCSHSFCETCIVQLSECPLCFIPFLHMTRPNPNLPLLGVLSALERLAEQAPVDVRNFLEQHQPIERNYAMAEAVEYLQHLSASNSELIKERERLGVIRAFQKGWLLYQNNLYTEALPYLEAASRESGYLGRSGYIQTQLGLGVCLNLAQRPMEAIPHLLYVREHSTSPRHRSLACFYLGIAQHKIRQYAEAIESLNLVKDSCFLTSERASTAKYLIGHAFFQTNQDAIAGAVLAPLLASHALSPHRTAQVHLILGISLYTLQRNREAIPHFIASATSPDLIGEEKIKAHYFLGKIFFSLNQYKAAVPHLAEAVDGLDAGSEERMTALLLYREALAATCHGCVVS